MSSAKAAKEIQHIAMVGDKELPHDVVKTEILRRLPAKSLLRFKCVCKDWYSLIISTSFVENHYATSKNQLSVFCYQASENNPEVKTKLGFFFLDAVVDLTIPYNIHYSGVVGCSKGVVCLSLTIETNLGLSIWFALWNPATRHSKKICEENQVRVGVKNIHGFCFHPIDNAFMLSRIIFSLTQEGYVARVRTFSLKDNTWKEKTKETGCPVFDSSRYLYLDHMKGVCVGRCMYWTLGYYKENWGVINKFILCYDMVNELFQRIEPPCAGMISPCLLQYKNTVAFICTFSISFQVWVMDDSGCANPSWSKPLTYTSVGMRFNLLDRSIGLKYKLAAVGFSYNGDEVNLVVWTEDHNFWECDTKGNVRWLRKWHPRGFFQYRESLTSFGQVEDM